MRTKLIVRLDEDRWEPVVLSADSAATVGDVVDLLAAATHRAGDPVLGSHVATPDAAAPPDARLRVVAPGVGSAHHLERDVTLVDAGLRSGSTVELDRTPPDRRDPPAVRLEVVDGPDAGLSVDLPAGVASIGRQGACTLALSDPTVSPRHARLVIGGGSGGVEVADNGSATGLQVGGGLVARARLLDGDTVGLGATTVRVTWLAPTTPAGATTVAFNRPPVVTAQVTPQELSAPTPPEPSRPQPLGWVTMLAPALLGVATFALTRNVLTLAFVGLSPLMMLGSWWDRRRGERRRLARETSQFRTELNALARRVRAAQDDEVGTRRERHPAPAHWVQAALTLSPSLWSRRPDDEEFLTVRAGLGRAVSATTVGLPPRGRARDELWATLTQTAEALREVDAVPAVVDLRRCGSLGLAGDGEVADGVARSLVAQVVAAHSPAQLRLVVLASRGSSARWAWTPWLPHTGPWSASDPAAAVAAVTALEQLLADRAAGSRLPAVLVVVEDDAPVDRGRLVRLAEDGPAAGVHVLWCATRRDRLPAACRAWLDVSAELGQPERGRDRAAESEAATSPVASGGAVLGLPDEHRAPPVRPEQIDAETVWRLALHLSGVTDAGAPEPDETDLPRAVDLLALTGPGLADDPSVVLARWRETDATRTAPGLRAVVGQGPDGPFVLDLRAQGPHALVGGTTGSGKSEFLQTWVLAMAAAHSPRRVTFLLVDYKGGAAFADCVDLPHCVGLVTDLSPHLVRRALTSLRAELTRRERLLAAAHAKDLAAMERSGDPRTPPALVIVVDEFAALVADVPQFVDGMVDIARRGRSLGLHLVLATQRPAGVIKDNLRANTNLRIALRTADEHDSTDVVGLPLTAHLDPSTPGRAAVRTGPGRVALFQTAYVGGRSVGRRRGPGLELSTLRVGPGEPWAVGGAAGPDDEDDDGPTDLRRVVDQISDAARLAALPAPRRPWLPDLGTVIDLRTLGAASGGVALGVVDLPARQAQEVWAWDPDEGALGVIGAAGTGKSAALRGVAVAAGLADPAGTQMYGLDFGAGGLAMLASLPFVGGVVEAGDDERIGRLLRDLLALVEDRARAFAAVRAGSLQRYRELSGRAEPRVFLLVDGLSAFRDAYETDSARLATFASFRRIVTEGRPLGVHVALAAERPGAIPTALAASVPVRLVLRQADQNGYRALDVPPDVLSPASPPGRCVRAGTGQEIQLAVLGACADPTAQAGALDAWAADLRAAGLVQAPPVRRLPARVSSSDLPDEVGGLPVLGIADESLDPVGFTPTGTFLLAGPPGSGRSTAVEAMTLALHRWDPALPLFYVGLRRGPHARLPWWAGTATSVDEAAELARALVARLTGAPSPVGSSEGLFGADPDSSRGLGADPVDSQGLGADRAASGSPADPWPESSDDRPGVAVVVEGLTDLIGTSAEQPMTELVRTLRRQGHLLVAEAETSAWGSAWPLVSEVRNARRGMVLTPDAVDGEALFRVPFGRVSRAQFPPGRGLYVEQGVARRVQLPLPGPPIGAVSAPTVARAAPSSQ